MDLKDFDQIEEGLYYLDKESKRIQAAYIYELRRRFILEQTKNKQINEMRDVVDEYDKLYKEGKEISAFILITKQPRHIVQKMFEKEKD